MSGAAGYWCGWLPGIGRQRLCGAFGLRGPGDCDTAGIVELERDRSVTLGAQGPKPESEYFLDELVDIIPKLVE